MRILFISMLQIFLITACSSQSESHDSASNKTNISNRWYSAGQITQGGQLYKSNCASCHGDKAQGLTKNWKETLADGSYPPPPLNGTAHAWHHPLPQLLRTIERGGVPLGGVMPGFADKLNDKERLAVVAYFQSFWADDIYQSWEERNRGNK